MRWIGDFLKRILLPIVTAIGVFLSGIANMFLETGANIWNRFVGNPVEQFVVKKAEDKLSDFLQEELDLDSEKIDGLIEDFSKFADEDLETFLEDFDEEDFRKYIDEFENVEGMDDLNQLAESLLGGGKTLFAGDIEGIDLDTYKDFQEHTLFSVDTAKAPLELSIQGGDYQWSLGEAILIQNTGANKVSVLTESEIDKKWEDKLNIAQDGNQLLIQSDEDELENIFGEKFLLVIDAPIENLDLLGGFLIVLNATNMEVKNIKSKGGVRLTAENIKSENLSLLSEGGASFEMSGEVTNGQINVQGGSHLMLKDLVFDALALELNGAGVAEVNVKNKLSGNLQGLGHVTYYGKPEVEMDSWLPGMIVAADE